MVKENPVYLFLGQDNSAKTVVLNRLKEKYLPKKTQDFNLDILYAKELSLKQLQEKILFLPVHQKNRMVVIKNAQELKPEIKDFLLRYAKGPAEGTVLVIDLEISRPKDDFPRQMGRFAQTCYFKEEKRLNVFDLSLQIESRKTAQSLGILHRLLQDGEKPERILGGLRASWQRQTSDPALIKKRIKLLLACDIEIKTGRIKPVFALERLIISLCGLQNFPG